MDERRPYQRLAVSRGAIDRAGRLLAARLIEAPTLVGPEVLDAMDVLADYRDAHRDSLRTTAEALRGAIREDVSAVATAHRLKRSRRIVEKLARFASMPLTSMQDIAGCRAVVASLADVAQLRDRLVADSHLILLREDDYNEQPRASGYRAHHLIVRVAGAPVEIQLRTTWQQAWTDRVERLDTDYDVGLKHERGPMVVREYLALLAYAEATSHLSGRVDASTDAELAALELASLAALRTAKADR
jgi:putative GTP pyrophosphokinase